MSYNHFILTIPYADFTPFLPHQFSYIKGQLEHSESGFLHWQIVVGSKKKVRPTAIKSILGSSVHVEPTRSAAADEYVWKDDTAVTGTRFELGTKPINRSSVKDWEAIRGMAKGGKLDDIPPDVFIRSYVSLKRISVDYCEPVAVEREVFVFWGATGTGKSRRAWSEAGIHAYPKDPNSKYWDGYRDHEHVVIDEFRGIINISNVLRWFDRYPVLVEVKGSSAVFVGKKIWITSNIHPREWYPGLDPSTLAALLRRLSITEFPFPIQSRE